MKKIVALLLAALMMMAMFGCSKDEDTEKEPLAGVQSSSTDVIKPSDDAGDNGEDKPAVEEDNVVMPARVTYEYTYNDDDYFTHFMTLVAYDESGNELWKYISPNSVTGQCDSLGYLGMNNGLVYVSECSIFDGEVKDGVPSLYGRLRALNAADGSVAWDNTEFDGAGACCAFDDEGNVYVAGYFGPDCMKIDRTGKTVWTVKSVDENLYWVYDLILENDVITVYYENESATAKLSADGEIIG